LITSSVTKNLVRRLQQRGQEGQPDRDRDEQEMVDRRERELPPREIECHPAPFSRREGPWCPAQPSLSGERRARCIARTG